MGRWRMFFRVISKAFWFRPGKLSASLGALTVGATLLSAFLSLYFVLPGQMSGEFKMLGPNLMLAPRQNDQTFSEDVYTRLGSQQAQVLALPWLYAVGQTRHEVANEEIVLAGTDLTRLASLNPSWKVVAGDAEKPASQSLAAFLAGRQGALQEQGGLFAGEKAAAHFGWNVGQTVELTYGGRAIHLPLWGVVSTGGSEDSQAILSISALQALTAQQARLSLIQIRAPGSAEQVEARRQEIAAMVPGVETKPLRQVVESEALVVMKVRALMYGLTAVVLGIVILSVMTTVSGLVLDRQRDIGIMKVLGGSERMISFLFVTEMSVTAFISALLGYGLGYGLAAWVAGRIFYSPGDSPGHSSLPWRWDALATVVAVTVAVALAATAFPIQRVRKLEPAVILKGN